MNRFIATALTGALLTAGLTACDRTAPLQCTDDAFVLTIAAPPKPPAPKAPKVQQPKAPKAKAPKVTVKEPKRNNGTVVVDADTMYDDDDDDCD